MTVVNCPSCGNTIHVPEKKTGLWWGIGCLAILWLLAPIAIPPIVRARDSSQLHGCFRSMEILDAAKEKAALQHGYSSGDAVSEADIAPFIKNGFASLVCPNGGRYTVNLVGRDPECSVHGALGSAMEGRGLPNQQSEGVRR